MRSVFERWRFCLDDRKPIAEGHSDKIGIGRGQRVLNGHVLVNPVRRFVRRSKFGHFRDQSVALRHGFLDTQRWARETNSRPVTSVAVPTLHLAVGKRSQRRRSAPVRLRLYDVRRFGLAGLRSSEGPPFPIEPAPLPFAGALAFRNRFHLEVEIRRVEIVLSCNAHEGEESITPGVSERRPHAARRGCLGDWAHRPFRRQRNTILKRAIYDNKIK